MKYKISNILICFTNKSLIVLYHYKPLESTLNQKTKKQKPKESTVKPTHKIKNKKKKKKKITIHTLSLFNTLSEVRQKQVSMELVPCV